MSIEQDKIDKQLLHLLLECARPSWRFRMMFDASERQMMQFAINTFMSKRSENLLMNELERRYGQGHFANVGGLHNQAQAMKPSPDFSAAEATAVAR
jgi:hypothetical protein